VSVRRGAALLGLVLAALLVSIGAAELLLAVARPVDYMAPAEELSRDVWRTMVHRPSEVPGLAYELAPTRAGEQGATNSHGMRDDEPLPAGAPGVLRIAALGDSFTFGLGVAREEAYPSVLEGMLARAPETSGRAIDVLNFGVGGYSSADSALVLEHKALAWSPDLILVGYVLNDPQTQPAQPLQRHFAPTRWWQYSHLARLAAQFWHQRERERLGGGDFYRHMHAEAGPHWPSVPRAFARMRELTAAAGVPVLVVIFPAEAESWDTYPYRDLHRQVARAAAAAGFEVLDLWDAFAAHEPSAVQIGPRDSHPTGLGHRVAAAAILARLRSDYADLLRRPRPRPG
jgi:lysophospholipase L1-like esterase